MDKNQILEQIHTAKAAHISWIQKAKLLIEGFEVDQNSIPVNSTECRFGKWYYSDAQEINSLKSSSLRCMKSVERFHFELHDIYQNIFKLYYATDKKDLSTNSFGEKKNIDDDTVKIGREYFLRLEKVSKSLLEEINRLEKRVVAIPNEEIEEL